MRANDNVKHAVAEAAGIDLETLDQAAFSRTIEAVMTRRGFASSDDYALALRGSASEIQCLIEELVVPETWFFRDRGPFQFLREWVRTFPRAFLRVLSAPCSTGEEPYSIAITLLEAGLPPDRFLIDGVDISQRALDTAKAAVYRKSSVREAWSGSQDYFRPAENGISVSPEITRLVRFHRDNLIRPSFLRRQSPYDVVFCRNLLIYLGADARQALLRTLDRLLAPGGVLVVGASEVPAFTRKGFTALPRPRSFACQRALPAAGSPQPAISPAPRRRSIQIPAASIASAPANEMSLDAAWRLADGGSLEEAARMCDRLLARDPDRPEHYFLKGLLSLAKDRLDTAEDLFQKTLYLDPDHYPALLHMSAICERRGERSKSELFRMRAKRIAERGGESHARR